MIPKLIILEGPSGAGKTTFLAKFMRGRSFASRWPAQNVSEGYHQTHFGAAPGDTPEDIFYHYVKIIDFLRGKPLIIDRWALSNMVYSHYLGNQVALGSDGLTKLQDRVKTWYPDHATLVFTVAPGILVDRNEGRMREEYIKTLEPVVRCFRTATGIKWMNPHLIDTTKLSPAQVYDRGMHILEKS